ncbi:hypothetical protein AR9_g244 [Bacillus phage AR9]|uniref:Uncharacterized protein n=2 Tax=Bacillus phage PBS1 TaxID=10683 RepID=A0A172JIF2_BPPB1|nr:hypothetical protein BI022_gp243 [Bacillus phage AR9]YP_009664337.1 hypothetical protein FK780_gp311 [Bacillus phage PBS1]AMS01328.1 hypothetical protein AR9_g244 [Bacillus phage AR9]AST99957.1 hypothetical protein PBI_PBS1_136 [Bacillus phage PBS1]BDE75527.1 hypothetical protein [Bacillus phage PBS1]
MFNFLIILFDIFIILCMLPFLFIFNSMGKMILLKNREKNIDVKKD